MGCLYTRAVLGFHVGFRRLSFRINWGLFPSQGVKRPEMKGTGVLSQEWGSELSTFPLVMAPGPQIIRKAHRTRAWSYPNTL